MYLEPEDSFILKVKAAEITTSDQYHLGVTMRFPRALSIRDDLSVADCMTASAVLESMRSERKRKMESDAGMSKKKRKTTAKKATVLPQYQGPDLRAVEVVSDLFEDMKFMVSSDPKSRTGNQDRQELIKLIHANGGSCVQVVTSKQPIIVIYGGTTTPYDIKLLIDKDSVDIIRPQWVTDCIHQGELISLKKKYFFHATLARQESDDYHQLDTDEDQEMTDGTVEEDASLKFSITPEGLEPKLEETKDIDPELVDWFQVDAKPAVPEDSETEEESDADSNNDDVKEEDDDDEWFQVPEVPHSHAVKPLDDNLCTTLHSQPQNTTMGEDDQAREYDTTAIFRHLCFYLDTPDNARRNGMPVKPKYEQEITTTFDQVSRSIRENGGMIVALDDSKLTHVVLDKRDDSRRLTLIQRTSRPKRRRLVISDYVTACLEEESLDRKSVV